MNHLVFLDRRAGELEKILSGVKTMLVKEFDPVRTTLYPINSGDGLYFLRDKEDCALRVKATVVRVLFFTNCVDEELSHTLKAMQSRLQLTEDQYNHWSTHGQIQLVEFNRAEKMEVIQIAAHKIPGRSDWIAFEEFRQIM
jgi:hypothetical protein